MDCTTVMVVGSRPMITTWMTMTATTLSFAMEDGGTGIPHVLLLT